MGIEFTGGYLIEVTAPQSIDPEAVQTSLKERGFQVATAQHLNDTKNLQIRLFSSERTAANESQSEFNSNYVASLLNTLHTVNRDITITRNEFIGASVGTTLKQDGILAFCASLLAILAYVSFRFNFKMAFSAVLALLHDAAVLLLVFCLTDLTFDLNVFAAVLAVVGYSLNDNIVIFDRFRSNSPLYPKEKTIDIFNLSVNQMLKRTIITSGVTLFSVVSLLFYGGEVLKNFSLALMIGVITGTYSTIYIASGLAIIFGADHVFAYDRRR